MPSVDALMDGELGIWLRLQDKKRKDAKQISLMLALLAAPGGIVTVLVLKEFGIASVANFFGGIVGAGLLFWALWNRQQVVNTLKQRMNGALAKALDLEYSRRVEPGRELEHARTFKLLPNYNRSEFEDRWSGQLQGTDFSLYEAVLKQKSSGRRNNSTRTVFRGLIIRFTFARDFFGTTLIDRDRVRFTLFGENRKLGGRTLEPVKMVDPRFEDAFDIFSTNQAEARYLVHPAYCERLIELEQSFEGKKLKALFHNGELLVTVSSKNLFESATLSPEKDRERLGKTIEQFAALSNLIKTLNEHSRDY